METAALIVFSFGIALTVVLVFNKVWATIQGRTEVNPGTRGRSQENYAYREHPDE